MERFDTALPQEINRGSAANCQMVVNCFIKAINNSNL